MIYKANFQNLPSKKPQEPVPPVMPAADFIATPVLTGRQPFRSTNINLNQPPVQPQPKKKRKISLKLIFGIIFLFILVLGGLFAYDRITTYSSRVEKYDEQGNKIAACDNILNPSCWTEAFRPQLKQADGFTNALLIGVDTRSGSNSLMNTDSLIILSFNHATQELMMISIPRDMWSFTYNSKINAVYALTYKKGRADKNDEFYYLKEELAKMTGMPIQYTGKIRFEGLINLVDKLGGVEVCPTDSFNAQYPVDGVKAGQPGWKSYKFTKGCQTVDGDRALVYARFRHLYSGPGYLASDFSRGHRQQEVINGIKNKALSDNVPIAQRAETYWTMFQSFGDIISFDINFEDMLAALAYINTFDRNPSNIVLDPNFISINSLIYTDSNSTQGYTIKVKDKSYTALHNEIAKIWKYSAFYRENPIITVRNQTGDKTLPADNPALKLQPDSAYYKSFNVFNDAKSTKIAGIKLFDFTNGSKAKSLEFIKKYLGITDVETLPESYGIARSKKNEDFLIVVGPKDLPTPAVTASPVPTTGN